ncbi:MAG TPA: ABC transporter permease [Gemmatimonadaceae bacterium]|nr:ABC transporter permease [Gemmatimonadaceae bacterium]
MSAHAPARDDDAGESPYLPHGPDARATATFPLPQRAGITFFRAVARAAMGVFGNLGRRVIFTREIARAFTEPRTYLPLTMAQLRAIGVDSLPLAGLVAAFIGAVSAFQTRYQLLSGVPLSTVGWIVRQMVVLELGPLLTALVLTGRVGARMTAEIGTMRVTEQIDALETLAYDPVAYLIVPRLLAGLVMLPVLTVIANAVGITSGLLVSIPSGIPVSEYVSGLRLMFIPFQVVYSLIKALLFGGAIALVCSYEGFVTEAGAEGVGRSTARAVVIASVLILALDALTALFLAPYLT